MSRSRGDVLVLFNRAVRGEEDAEFASEAGVLVSVAAFERELGARGFRVRAQGVADDPAEILDALAAPRPDVVVNLCESFAGRAELEAPAVGLIELAGLPFTGAGSAALALARDKPRAKRLLAGAGIATAEAVLLRAAEELDLAPADALLAGGACLVKPAGEDASLGLSRDSVVHDRSALARQVALVRARFGDVLVERYLPGREFNVAIVADPAPRVLPLSEIVFDRARMPFPLVTYLGKWDPASEDCDATPVRCPAEVDPPLARELERVALLAFAEIGCRDYARVDLRLDEVGRPHVLEVNPNPDLDPEAGFARALGALGPDAYGEFLARLVRGALARGASTATPGRARERSPRPAPACELRPLRASDVGPLAAILGACGLFRADEVEVGREVLEEAARDGEAGHYRVLVAERDGRALGWSCHGRVPMSDASFDLYWIAVQPEAQGQGIGAKLLDEVEARVRAAGGRWLLAETSDCAAYRATRAFYRARGYRALGLVPDFYRPRDGRTTFGKRLDGT